MEPEINPFAELGIEMQTLLQEWESSRQHVEQFTRDFKQLDNLVDAVPLNRQENMPFVGDTTLAGLVRSIPRASLKQLPVLATVVNGTKNSITAQICNFLLRKKVFNEDTFGKGLLSTLQLGTEQAITHGYAPFMVAAEPMYDEYGTKLRLLHYSDTSLEPGVSDYNESGYFFVSAYLTKSRVRRILRLAEGNPNTTWNVEGLRQILMSDPPAKDYSQYLPDVDKSRGGQDMGRTYEFVTRYEVGKGGNIITFCKSYPEAPLRFRKNRSKWGYPKVQYLVIDPAPLTPFGTSRVRLASPNQNFMNIYYASIAAMLLLNSNPPVFKKGSFLKPTPLKRGAIWESVDPGADITLKTMDNGALSQFVPMAQQFMGQIQNIMGGQTMTINAGSKGSVFGKTAPGVQAGQDFANLEINQVTNILENFLRQYALVALDTLICEESGTVSLIVDDEAKNNINQIVPGTIGDDNRIEITWEDFYAGIEQWSVEVEVSLSPDELKDEKRKDIQDILVTLSQNAQVIPGAPEKIQELYNMLIQDNVPLAKPIQTQPTMPEMMPEQTPPQM